jgi:hypothetical protein
MFLDVMLGSPVRAADVSGNAARFSGEATGLGEGVGDSCVYNHPPYSQVVDLHPLTLWKEIIWLLC